MVNGCGEHEIFQIYGTWDREKCKILLGKHMRHEYRWDDNMEMDFNGMGFESVD
jgi:hypothetical protein